MVLDMDSFQCSTFPVPRGLRVKLPLRSRNIQKIADRTNLAVLRQLIRDNREKKVRIEKLIHTCESTLRNAVTENQWSRLQIWANASATKVADTTKARQIKKFNQLILSKLGPSLDVNKVVKNISQRTLTTEEEQVLSLGLNFAITPRTILIADIIVASFPGVCARGVNLPSHIRLGTRLTSLLPRKQQLDNLTTTEQTS